MQSGYLKYSGVVSFALLLMLWVSGLAGAETAMPKQKKKYPPPHKVHLSAMSTTNADFVAGEIGNWPELVRSFQKALHTAPAQALFGVEFRLLLAGFRPDAVTGDNKAVVTNELNRILADASAFAQVKGSKLLSRETEEREVRYQKTGSSEDLKWLNRSVLSDMFPQVPRKQKGKDMKKITCTTCHEAYKQEADSGGKGVTVVAFSEKEVLACFARVIAEDKPMGECIEKANMLKKTKIPEYGPLKNYVQRGNPEETDTLLIAVHPEAPYTFKPLLKRLVCLECHSAERKVDTVMGSNGKMKEIPLFYGVGSGRHKHDHDQE
ncbi:MAG: hypothetical protein K8I29_03815 [Alphaproteobacteria bacterium]|uniref:Uncharacterized protein n=1 Tax=Candidatus Nitrobium versatile TaxID=2884831 RepID=A0A953LVW9_9BACT|nr:hypothetical protein [Candidatus Nitrobium versatile]